MDRVPVSPLSRLEDTLTPLSGAGALLCTLAPDGRPNVMTIGWATFGVIWGRPIACVLVRPERYTFGGMEATGDFTIGILGPDGVETLAYCGGKSGRDTDKIADCGLALAPSQHVRSPLLDDAVITYECRVVHKHDLQAEQLDQEILGRMYGGGGLHRVYYGHILAVTAAS